MTIARMKTIYASAADVPACADFYVRALGAQPRFRDGDNWVQFSLDGLAFAVASFDEAPRDARGAIFVFEATDQADHQRVLDAGAQDLGGRDMGDHGQTRTYADPAGNLFQLFWAVK